MADILLPPGIYPTRIEWTLRRNVASAASFLTRDTQEINRQGSLWGCTLEFGPLDPEKSARLSAWLDQISRAEHCGLVPVFQNTDAGTETAGFVSAQSPFTAANVVNDWNGSRGFANGLLIPPYYQSGDLVLYSGNTTSNSCGSGFAATAGLPYAAVLDTPLQSSPPTWQVTGAGLTPVHFTATAVQGRSVAVWNAVGSQNAIVLGVGNGVTAFVQSRFTSLTLNRILLVQGATAAGASQMFVFGGNSAAPSLAMRRGQFFEVRTSAGFELKRLMTDVDFIAGVTFNGNSVNHLGRAVFEPALRGGAADFAAVLTHKPVCRMKLATPQSVASIGPPLRSGFVIELIERLP